MHDHYSKFNKTQNFTLRITRYQLLHKTLKNALLKSIFHPSFYKQLDARSYFESNLQSSLDMEICDRYTTITV